MLLKRSLITARLAVDAFEDLDDNAREPVRVDIGFLIVWDLTQFAV
jgi:hypothetical protein